MHVEFFCDKFKAEPRFQLSLSSLLILKFCLAVDLAVEYFQVVSAELLKVLRKRIFGGDSAGKSHGIPIKELDTLLREVRQR